MMEGISTSENDSISHLIPESRVCLCRPEVSFLAWLPTLPYRVIMNPSGREAKFVGCPGADADADVPPRFGLGDD